MCLLEEDIPDATKQVAPCNPPPCQALASEMNISETCFLTLAPGAAGGFAGSAHFGLRWFTPTNEVPGPPPRPQVPLCGHATLAAAAVLFQASGNVHSRLHFATLSGELTAEREGGRVVLQLPLHPPPPLWRAASLQPWPPRPPAAYPCWRCSSAGRPGSWW